MRAWSAALALSWYAFRMGRRRSTPERSHGHPRSQILAALINGGTLIAIAVWITVEAVQRLFEPVQVLGGTMLTIALIGLAVNVDAFAILHGGSREKL